MPNHCENDLRLTGPRQDILDFLEVVRGQQMAGETLQAIDFNKIIPYPEQFALADKAAADFRENNAGLPFSECPKDGYNSGGYDWCVLQWGTKWNAYSFSEVRIGLKSTSMTFLTAWAPPLPVILKASEMFPTLTFTLRYFERGAGYKGILQSQGGEVLLEDQSEYRGARGG